MKRASVAIAGLLAALLVTSARADGQIEIDDATGLVVAPGWELVRGHCGGCHSYKLVTQQSANRDAWLDTIRWMQATQNLWQFDPESESIILDYLAANYAPAAERRRAPIPPELMPPSEQAAAR